MKTKLNHVYKGPGSVPSMQLRLFWSEPFLPVCHLSSAPFPNMHVPHTYGSRAVISIFSWVLWEAGWNRVSQEIPVKENR